MMFLVFLFQWQYRQYLQTWSQNWIPNCTSLISLTVAICQSKSYNFFNYFTSSGYLYYRSKLQNVKETWYQGKTCCYKRFHHIVILEICKSLHLKTKGCFRENKLFKQEILQELDKRWNCNLNKRKEPSKETTRNK